MFLGAAKANVCVVLPPTATTLGSTKMSASPIVFVYSMFPTGLTSLVVLGIPLNQWCFQLLVINVSTVPEPGKTRLAILLLVLLSVTFCLSPIMSLPYNQRRFCHLIIVQ